MRRSRPSCARSALSSRSSRQRRRRYLPAAPNDSPWSSARGALRSNELIGPRGALLCFWCVSVAPFRRKIPRPGSMNPTAIPTLGSQAMTHRPSFSPSSATTGPGLSMRSLTGSPSSAGAGSRAVRCGSREVRRRGAGSGPDENSIPLELALARLAPSGLRVSIDRGGHGEAESRAASSRWRSSARNGRHRAGRDTRA